MNIINNINSVVKNITL